jgi:nucleotide-binding universal stress UspA family protein
LLHLANHGIEIEENVAQVREHADLGRQIADGNYDLVVMGGSSNPAWVNFLFGDVTQSILLSSTVPVLVSQ